MHECDTTALAFTDGLILFTYLVGLVVWLVTRGGTSAGLDWRKDLKGTWLPVKHVLVQERGWLFGGVALTVIQSLVSIHELHGDKLCVQATCVAALFEILANLCTIGISWAVIRKVVDLKTPEKLHELDAFKGSAFSLICDSGDLLSKNFRIVASYLIPASLVLWILPEIFIPGELLLDNWQVFTPMTPLCTCFFVSGYLTFFLVNVLASAFLAALTANLYLHLKGSEDASNPVATE